MPSLPPKSRMDCSQSDMARDEGSSTNVVNGHRRKGKERGSKEEKKELLCVLLGVDCQFTPDKGFNNAAQVKEDVHRHLLSFQCDCCLKRFPKMHNLNRHNGPLNPCKRPKEGKELSVDQINFLKELNDTKGIKRIKEVVKPWKTLFAADEYLQKVNTRKRKSSEIPADSVPGAQKKIRRNETDSGTPPSGAGGLTTGIEMYPIMEQEDSGNLNPPPLRCLSPDQPAIREQEGGGRPTLPPTQYTRPDQLSSRQQEESGNYNLSFVHSTNPFPITSQELSDQFAPSAVSSPQTHPLLLTQYTHLAQLPIMEQEGGGRPTLPPTQYTRPDQLSSRQQEESGNFNLSFVHSTNPFPITSQELSDQFAPSAVSSPQTHPFLPMQYTHPAQLPIMEQEGGGHLNSPPVQYINPAQISISSEAVSDTFPSFFMQGSMIAISPPQRHLREQNEVNFFSA
ncbi:hypothetical protein BDZ91DRAFT_848838 [Kalaharituber pfeilii]|nr:hypothetical protein BDZ91DRAFT_848838 [Kalaharituber pfeilii]